MDVKKSELIHKEGLLESGVLRLGLEGRERRLQARDLRAGGNMGWPYLPGWGAE